MAAMVGSQQEQVRGLGRRPTKSRAAIFGLLGLSGLNLLIAQTISNRVVSGATPVPTATAGTQPRDKQPPVQTIIERVRGGEVSALLELGDMGDTNAIPVLEKYVVPGGAADADPAQRQYAVQALAKLGAEKHYEELIRRLSAEYTAQADRDLLRIFDVLSYIPSKAAVRTIGQFLNDPTVHLPHSDVKGVSIRVLAAHTLAAMSNNLGQMIPDPPTPKDRPPYQTGDIEKWQQWWITNKSKYAE